MKELFNDLNAAQREAAAHKLGPLVVFAGAGSGKTRIITTRIAHLIATGVAPWNILAVTFTNKAAGEMKHRVESISPEARRTLISTFHSACARWLREFASELGFDSNFTIFDDGDSNSALKKIVREVNPKGELPTLLSSLKSFIQMAKTYALTPTDIDKYQDHLGWKIPIGGVAIYRMYQEYLASCNAMDFGDLLLNMLLLLRTNDKVRDIMQSRYQYILVDEFQDTNRTQFELIRLLAEHHQNLFVVGDDDQSIYSWRGAAPSNILDFNQTYPNTKVINLEQNYRCSANIVNAASVMIAHNKIRADKTLFSTAPDGDPIEYRMETDGEMEAWWIVDTIKRESARFSWDEVAIFYRTNSQSRLFEEYLTHVNIPYTIFGSIEFYGRMEVKDLLAYLKVVVNDIDAVSLRRILNVPARGLGDKALEIIEKESLLRNKSMFETIKELGDELFPRIGPKLKYFYDLIQALKRELLDIPLDEVIGILLEATEYKDYLKKKYPDQLLDKLDNVHELGSAMAEYKKQNPEARLPDWLQTVTLVRSESDENSMTGVSLMTLHMAKGLEFERVFLAGLEDGLLPHSNSMENEPDLEEERRLFYVGMTRAKSKLSLTSAKTRRNFNQVFSNDPSRFLREIPQKYLIFSHDETPDASQDLATTADEYEPREDDKMQIGSKVFHPTYGSGIIKEIDHNFGRPKAVVDFSEFGLRRISFSQLDVRKY